MRIPVYVYDGLLETEVYWMLPVLFVVAIAGSYIGKRFVGKIQQGIFRKVVLGALILAGLKLVIDYLLQAGH